MKSKEQPKDVTIVEETNFWRTHNLHQDEQTMQLSYIKYWCYCNI
jgi:hypothetical protein